MTTTTRRGFFGTLLGLAVAPLAAKLLPPPTPALGLGALVRELPKGTVVYGITPATFTFWRNQTPSSAVARLEHGTRHANASMMRDLERMLYAPPGTWRAANKTGMVIWEDVDWEDYDDEA